MSDLGTRRLFSPVHLWSNPTPLFKPTSYFQHKSRVRLFILRARQSWSFRSFPSIACSQQKTLFATLKHFQILSNWIRFAHFSHRLFVGIFCVFFVVFLTVDFNFCTPLGIPSGNHEKRPFRAPPGREKMHRREKANRIDEAGPGRNEESGNKATTA